VKKKKPARRRRRAGIDPLRSIIMENTYSAFRDESYSLILRCVEDMLKDPKLRGKIDDYARRIAKSIAAKM
jgi:hypothetical protein